MDKKDLMLSIKGNCLLIELVVKTKADTLGIFFYFI
jgi:hypothetical protein